MRAAAIEGLGIVYLHMENLAATLKSGTLVRLLEGFEDSSRANWIVYPERRYMPLRVRRTIEYLQDAFKTESK